MCTFGVGRYFISSVLVFGLLCSANDIVRLKARVKHLETRLNFQVSFRDEEYAEITERLDDIDKVLNDTVERTQPVVSERTTLSKLDYKYVNSLSVDFARIRTAFREEKAETERIRREIPKIENNLVSIADDVDNYCKTSLNNTDQLLNRFAIEKGILVDVKENIQAVKKSTEKNLLEHAQEQKILQDIAEKVNSNTDNGKRLTERIEKLESLVSNEFVRIENLLLYGPSCLYLKYLGTKDSDVYNLKHGLKVYCDLVTDGGGWTVFQRRFNGDVDFYRNWTEYKKGFGDLNGEFWLGNDYLSALTADGDHELRVEVEDFDGNIAYAKYKKFQVYPEEDKYKLKVSGYSGTAGDSLKYHNGMMFSTFDRDNDKWSTNCASTYHGAWWYNSCHYSNLNGRYYDEAGKIDTSGITWYYWKKSYYCLKKVEMKFR